MGSFSQAFARSFPCAMFCSRVGNGSFDCCKCALVGGRTGNEEIAEIGVTATECNAEVDEEEFKRADELEVGFAASPSIR